jgi:hypothetical protein
MAGIFNPSDCNFTNPLNPGQLNRNYPGDSEQDPGADNTRFYEELGPWQNPNADITCVTVDLVPGTGCLSGSNDLVIIGAFTAFNPVDKGDGYLGDIANLGEFTEFGFKLPGNEQFALVMQQIRSNDNAENGVGCVVTATVDFGNCPP